MVGFAGLQDIVQILVGPSHESLVRLAREDMIDHVELLFIDHWKDRYVPDLHLLERLRLLKPGVSVFVADNVLGPGCPEYLDWVRGSPAEKRELLKKSHPNYDGPGSDVDLVKVLKE